MNFKKSGFREPALAQSGRVGINGFPIPFECRVVAEDNYQKLMSYVEELERKVEAL